MTPWFADTFYFLALRNPKGLAHAKAMAFARLQGPRTLVTTSWVLTEVGDALADPGNRLGFIDLLTLLRSNPQAFVVLYDEALFGKGIQLYQNRPDKAWSLTDCVSFVVMQELGVSEALPGDHHFEQAGFVALLKA